MFDTAQSKPCEMALCMEGGIVQGVFHKTSSEAVVTGAKNPPYWEGFLKGYWRMPKEGGEKNVCLA